MKEKCKIYATTAFIVLLAFVFGFSVTYANKNDNKGLIKDLREDVRNYAEKNVFPEMLDWKSMLDKSMSKEDLAKLDELRSKASVLKEEMKKKRMGIQAEGKEEDWDKEELKDKMKDESKEFMSELKEISVELKPLAEKYMDVLKNIGEKAKPKKEEWENGILIIINNWKNEHKEELENIKDTKKFDKNVMKQTEELSKLGFDNDKKKVVAKFMLWDGSKPLKDFENENTKTLNNRKVTSENDGGLRTFPNPFNEKTTIYFTLSKSDNVNLSVYDDSGNKITVLFEGELSSGEHSFVFNTKSYKNLPAGSYTYKLITSDGTKSGRMVFTK